MSVVVEDEDGVVVETRPLWKKRRYLVVLMAFLGFVNIFTLRINLSVGIVAMTENRTVEHEDGSVTYEKYFDWDSKQQGLILSSFFYGYICTQLIGGYVASQIGGNVVLGLGIFTTAVLTLFTPLAAEAGVGAFVALRVLMGLAEGVAFPCMHEIWSKWAPPFERSRMASIQYAGTYVGMVIAMSSCGYMAAHLGWQSVFYVYGGIGCVWYALWVWIVRESPEKDPYISDEEKRYIMASLKHSKNAAKPIIPWRSIFTSTAVWAIAVAHFAENWGVYTIVTQLPLFLKYNLKYDLVNSGFIAAVPYITLGIILLFVGYLADMVQAKGYLTTTQTRKYFNCAAFASQTTFMMLAAYQRDRVLVIVFITFGAGLGALSLCGYGVNHLDIAPQYASILMGISNTVATIPGIASPLIAGFIVTEQTDAGQWQWIFILTSCVYLFGFVFYWIFCSGKVQPWAIVKDENDTKKHDPVDDIDSDNVRDKEAS